MDINNMLPSEEAKALLDYLAEQAGTVVEDVKTDKVEDTTDAVVKPPVEPVVASEQEVNKE